ncbi:MAG: 3,4-dihydroxy-2-butanone-4-phosphate synthase [Gammaproteobacteria bacterium]|nr:3,4-dihydroxy-2-butanone-4-phosphate synthase [Gammaproteobacteria bacterium]PCH62124.1 MAG: 3,4-dihydroxy-2-butanone-4-phosphate synthase [Gammaproteobacteria bacterium]PCH62658.1 MAG: 3,4-dihydroxy-2-butanone-4-phosphate synthase [Gammaproteobacteria bacterium]
MPLNTIEEIIEDIRNGKMVVLMDDEDRENEGDLIMAAEKVETQDINFMARFGRGLICLTLTPERCQQLALPLMVHSTNAEQRTNFTLSIEASTGVTTGISAADRATTIKAAVAANATAADIRQPGHVFPIMAQPGNVLTRAGHTEAGCDLARLAGLDSSAVIVEILNEDGTMARRPDLEIFAAEHDLKMGTIADLISYRLNNEKTISRGAESVLPTEFGEFKLVAYRDLITEDTHLALISGEIKPDEPVLVRVHVQDTFNDILSLDMAGAGIPLHKAMQTISSSKEPGVVIILAHDTSAKTFDQRVEALNKKNDSDKDSAAYNDVRTYGVGAQMLVDLGVSRMRIVSSPKRFHGLSGFGLEVIDYVRCHVP